MKKYIIIVLILFIIIYRSKCRAESDEKKSEYEKTSKVGNYFKTYYLKIYYFVLPKFIYVCATSV